MDMIRRFLTAPSLALLLVGQANAADAPLTRSGDAEVIRKLNDNYFRSWREHDMAWYRQHLAEDFVFIGSDGSVLGKEAFVGFPDPRASIKHARIEDVVVRVYPGGTAVVSANTVVDWNDGRVTATRYIDVYARVSGEWKVVSAQLTADRNFNEAQAKKAAS